LRRHHLQHHFGVPHRKFGVTSPLWDVIFRTTR
jgi:sterol desaturase/sphingolipid hydroxylase (fatty acid hydroxylase superfamily)